MQIFVKKNRPGAGTRTYAELGAVHEKLRELSVREDRHVVTAIQRRPDRGPRADLRPFPIVVVDY